MEDSEIKQLYKEIAELKLKVHSLELRYLNSQGMLKNYIKEFETRMSHFRQTKDTDYLEEIQD